MDTCPPFDLGLDANHLPVLQAVSPIPSGPRQQNKEPYLDKSDVGCLLPEALAADIEPVLADQTGLVGADAAVQIVSSGYS